MVVNGIAKNEKKRAIFDPSEGPLARINRSLIRKVPVAKLFVLQQAQLVILENP